MFGPDMRAKRPPSPYASIRKSGPLTFRPTWPPLHPLVGNEKRSRSRQRRENQSNILRIPQQGSARAICEDEDDDQSITSPRRAKRRSAHGDASHPEPISSLIRRLLPEIRDRHRRPASRDSRPVAQHELRQATVEIPSEGNRSTIRPGCPDQDQIALRGESLRSEPCSLGRMTRAGSDRATPGDIARNRALAGPPASVALRLEVVRIGRVKVQLRGTGRSPARALGQVRARNGCRPHGPTGQAASISVAIDPVRLSCVPTRVSSPPSRSRTHQYPSPEFFQAAGHRRPSLQERQPFIAIGHERPPGKTGPGADPPRAIMTLRWVRN